jgi:outer membrane PBP1 activator LpoA protein
MPLFSALLLTTLTLLLAGCAAPPRSAGPGPVPGGAAPDQAVAQARVAVLLPQSGRYAEAGAAVRQGILAAQSTSGQGPEFRFYDSHNPKAVPDLLRQAAAEGASLAIGPLDKEAVDALASQPALPIPTLALNRANSDATPPNLYQFSLDPEDEAADAARKAWGQGYHTAILLYPASPWGERLANGFRREWLGFGGSFAAIQPFDPNSAELPQGLLEDAFAGSVQAAPADCVFLVATAPQARRLWPEIFAINQNPPSVFATSHLFEGGQDQDGNQALLGLQFVDIPWMIDIDPADPLSRSSLERTSGGIDPRYARLYAMGIDAYALVQQLEGLTARPGAYLEGRTGRLSLDNRGRVQRELILARMDSLGPRRMTATKARAPNITAPTGSPGGGGQRPALTP